MHTFAVMVDAPEPIATISENANAVLKKALAKDAVNRFPSCQHFVSALNGAWTSVADEPEEKNEKPVPVPPKETVKPTVKPKGDGDNRYHSQYSDIFMAARYGTMEDVWYFLEGQKTYYTAKETRVKRKFSDGCTALHHAAADNPDVSVAKYLVTRGADVNTKSNVGWTPLHYAANSNSRCASLFFCLTWAKHEE
jgi:hypothetical protein